MSSRPGALGCLSGRHPGLCPPTPGSRTALRRKVPRLPGGSRAANPLGLWLMRHARNAPVTPTRTRLWSQAQHTPSLSASCPAPHHTDLPLCQEVSSSVSHQEAPQPSQGRTEASRLQAKPCCSHQPPGWGLAQAWHPRLQGAPALSQLSPAPHPGRSGGLEPTSSLCAALACGDLSTLSSRKPPTTPALHSLCAECGLPGPPCTSPWAGPVVRGEELTGLSRCGADPKLCIEECSLQGTRNRGQLCMPLPFRPTSLLGSQEAGG